MKFEGVGVGVAQRGFGMMVAGKACRMSTARRIRGRVMVFMLLLLGMISKLLLNK